MTTVHQQFAVDSVDCMSSGNVPVKLYQDAVGAQIRPHLLAASADTELDGLDDLPDVGAELQRSGILDAGGTPNSLTGFDVSDLDTGDGFQFDGILGLSDRTTSSLLPPLGGMFGADGRGSQSVPFPVAQILPEYAPHNPVVIHRSTLFAANASAAVNQNGPAVSTVCSQRKPDSSSKFVSSILSGSGEDGRQTSHGRSLGRTKPTAAGSSSGFLANDREAPEYRRVMDILTEYQVEVAGKGAEAMTPCKRRKSRPIVDAAVEASKSAVGPTLNHCGAVCNPWTCVRLTSSPQGGPAVEQSGDLSSSDSLASNGSAVHPLQDTLGIVSTNSPVVVAPNPVTGRALDIAVPLTPELSRDDMNYIPSASCSEEATFESLKSSSVTSSSTASAAASNSADKSSKIYDKSCAKGLEPVPECRCCDNGK